MKKHLGPKFKVGDPGAMSRRLALVCNRHKRTIWSLDHLEPVDTGQFDLGRAVLRVPLQAEAKNEKGTEECGEESECFHEQAIVYHICIMCQLIPLCYNFI
jgi:hypothetical protein